jgi:hypothetical protein
LLFDKHERPATPPAPPFRPRLPGRAPSRPFDDAMHFKAMQSLYLLLIFYLLFNHHRQKCQSKRLSLSVLVLLALSQHSTLLAVAMK